MIITKRALLTGAASLLSGVAGRPKAATAVESTGEPVVLDVQASTIRLLPDSPAIGVIRFAGQTPLRIIRIRKGETLAASLTNSADEAVSLQWHGLRGQNSLDDPMTKALGSVPSGARRTLSLTSPDSGTSWFHANPGRTDQTARGLAGVLVVEEADPPTVDQDLVVLMLDWTIDGRHQVIPGAKPSAASPTTVITVNGSASPLDWNGAPGSRMRLRLINGSTRRVMLISCEGARPLIIAIDGQPSELFEPIRDTVPIGPGARFDYIVDLPTQAGKTIQLTLKGTERASGSLEPDRPLVRINTLGTALEPKAAVTALPSNPLLPPKIALELSKRVELAIEATDTSPDGRVGRWTVNGVSGVDLSKTPVLKVRQGDAVTVGFSNKSSVLVPIRVQGQAMRLLHTKDDGWEPYWRDSLLLPPMSHHHVAFNADLPGQWLIESAFNDQNVAGLRCWFEVTRPS